MGRNFTRIGALIILQLFMLSSAASAILIPAAPPAQENSQAPYKSAAFSAYWDLERVDFIHYAKPTGAPATKKTDPGYKLMGVKWLTPEGYAINNANIVGEGLDTAAVITILEKSSTTWNEPIISKDLFGAISPTEAKYGVYDETNTIAFGPYSGSSNVIAVTSVWYTRTTKQIVEFDMLFNTYYPWGDADISGSGVMDLQNIATHEFGHAVGLADVYSASWSEVTMYGYATAGETKKRSLEETDLAGLRKIYGQ